MHTYDLTVRQAKFADVWKCIWFQESFFVMISILPQFVSYVLIDNVSVLVQMPMHRQTGGQPSTEPRITPLDAYVRNRTSIGDQKLYKFIKVRCVFISSSKSYRR